MKCISIIWWRNVGLIWYFSLYSDMVGRIANKINRKKELTTLDIWMVFKMNDNKLYFCRYCRWFWGCIAFYVKVFHYILLLLFLLNPWKCQSRLLNCKPYLSEKSIILVAILWTCVCKIIAMPTPKLFPF